MSKKIKIYIIFSTLIILGFIFYPQRIKIKDFLITPKNVNLPVEQSLNDLSSLSADLEINDNNNDSAEMIHESSIQNNDNVTMSPNPRTDNIIKQEINLKVPFTIQSPDQKWDEKYKEGCEEASILMVYSYLKNKSITVNSAMSDIGKMIDLQITKYGGQYNLSASTTAQLANQFFGVNHELVEIKSAQDIKRILSDGNPLILPTLGRELYNPNFKSPGPIYHMLVVKGYTKDGIIITNDPGTRKGKDYTYNPDILFNAIGDWDYNIESPNANLKIGIILK
ncbi:MAG TPA: C39 family peptidase [bacterium]|nr:C39 family peptidase [bacterium]